MGRRDLSWLTAAVYLGLIAGTEGSELWTHGFKRVQWLSSLVVGNHLYLDGGEVVNETYGYTQGSTLQIDLTKYWYNGNVTAKYADKYQPYPYVRSPALFSDGEYLYTYGGIPYFWHGCIETGSCSNPIYLGGAGHSIGAVPHTGDGLGPGGELASRKSILKNMDFPRDLYQIRIADFTEQHAWKKATKQPPKSIHPMQAPSILQQDDMVYALGGFSGNPYYSRNINYIWANKGLASWKSDATGWKNESSNGFKPTGTNTLGQGVYVPFGEKGALVFLGGYSPPSPSFEFADYSTTPEKVADMSLINIYDIATKTWYSQRTAGRTPIGRFSFCAVSVSESGSNTAEIFMHGGYASTRNSEPYNDDLANIFMLSIPSFVWTAIPRTVQPYMRANPTCEVIGNRQMVVIGGVNPADDTLGLTPDPWNNGILLFDMSNWSWTPNYNPNAKPYKRNEKLLDQIRSLRYPITWSSPEVEAYFKKYAHQTITPLSQASGGKDNGTDAGAIAGGVVGGVLGLALIIGAFLLWRWRRRKAQQQSAVCPTSAEDGTPTYHAEAPHENEKPSPSELPEQKKPVELGPPQLWELEQPSEKTAISRRSTEKYDSTSTPVSERTRVDDDVGQTQAPRFEMEG